MAIPKHDDIRVPAMKLLEKNGTMKLRDFTEPLAKYFNLTDDEVSEMYASGNGHIFYDRISWALSYLNMAGLLEKPRRGMYQVNQKGIELLKTPDKINDYVRKQVESRESTKQRKQNLGDKLSIDDDVTDLTPQEKLYVSFSNIRKLLIKRY